MARPFCSLKVATFDRLRAQLGDQTTLLLDNCEHLLDAVAGLVERLIASCPGLRVLATSREGLGLDGEQMFPVRPLTLPAGDDRAAAQDCEAVRLFVERAARVRPDFTLDDGKAAAIAAVCRRLDGIALAIELAAARVGMLSVEKIAERLADRFRFLVGASRAQPRHQTLQATLHWSHDSLPPEEQQLFRQLAVVGGGCTLAVATQICGMADEFRVLALLTRLNDKSLLVVDQVGQEPAQYHMLETVRQYAQESLDAEDEGAAAPPLPLLVRGLGRGSGSAAAGPAARRLDGAVGRRAGQPAGRSRLVPGPRRWCQEGAAPGGLVVALLGRVRAAGARPCAGRGGIGRGGVRTRHWAIEVAGRRPLARPRGVGGRPDRVRMGRYTESLAHADEGLRIAVTQGDAEQIAAGLGLRAKGLHSTGHAAAALLQYEQACEVARTLDNTSWLGTALNNLAELHRSAGDLDQARACYEEAICIARGRQSPEGIFVPLCNLARLSVASGHGERARALLLESLQLASGAELKGMGEDVLEVAAGLASVRQHYDHAARFAGAAQSRMRESGNQREPVDEAFFGPLVERARSMLGDERFDAARAEGGVWSHDAAIHSVRLWLEAAAA